MTDEPTKNGGPAAPETTPAGPSVIRRYLRNLGDAPGVYRMLDAEGGALYVGKARSLKKRVAAYAKYAGHSNRIQRMIAATRRDGVHHHPDRDRGAAAGGEPHQATEAPLQRAAARRQELPAHPDRGRRLAADAQAPRRPAREGALLRTLRLGGRGEPDPEPAAEGLPAPHLLGLGLPEPDAPLPAAPDQALRRPLRRQGERRGLRGAGAGRDPIPRGPLDPGAGGTGRPYGRGQRGDGVRARRGLPRPAPGARPCAGPSGHQPPADRRGGRGGASPRRGAGLRAGVLLPLAPELGQPGLFPAHLGRGGGRRDPRGVPRPVLCREEPAAHGAAEPCHRRRRAPDRGAVHARRAARGGRPAPARREARAGRPRAAERPRGARPQDGRERQPGASCSPRSPRVSASTSRPGGSRSTTTATSRARTRSAR